MKHKANYIFTNKKHSKRGIMSTILGIISMISIIAAIYITFLQKGVAAFNYGIAVLLSALFALAGLWLGVRARMEKDRFYIFAYVGIAFNLITVAAVGFILYAGVCGL